MDHMGQLHNNYMLLTGWGVRIAMDLSFSDGQFDGPTFSESASMLELVTTHSSTQ